MLRYLELGIKILVSYGPVKCSDALILVENSPIHSFKRVLLVYYGEIVLSEGSLCPEMHICLKVLLINRLR